MKSMRFPLALLVALVITFNLAMVCAQAQTIATLSVFNGINGRGPQGSPIQSINGTFYGSTTGGGLGYGNIYEVMPSGELRNFYSFCALANCTDGQAPVQLMLGSDGNFYGVTAFGGANVGYIGGTVFKMTQGGVLTTLHSFCSRSNCSDGEVPDGLVQATDGNFYGSTAGGGANGYSYGTLFEITPAGKFKVLYSFCSLSNCLDGETPAEPYQASDGNFYGVAMGGGSYGEGVVYELTSSGSYSVLYNFCSQSNCADGSYPLGAQLVQDASGNLYGVTRLGGQNGEGTVFEITPSHQLCCSV
jgi:uncharacterized repeat protein (TIGR03803 family)